jgi:uncharacterized protein YciW
MTDIFAHDVVLDEAGISTGSPLRAALEARSDVLAMTQATHDAALRPFAPGGLSHAERAALAARVARLNGEDGLAAHYRAMLAEAKDGQGDSKLADPAFTGGGDARCAALIAYTDLVTLKPRDATAADIEMLKAAGIDDADIVRLAELNAFLAYQMRLVAGLRLMKAAPDKGSPK